MTQYKYSDITQKIIWACMEVHKNLWTGFQEIIYQRALYIELENAWLNFWREIEMDVNYKWKNIWTRRVDFLIEKKIILEIKALVNLEDVHLAQAINYLEAYNLEIWLLVNFWAKSLQFKRLMNNKLS